MNITELQNRDREKTMLLDIRELDEVAEEPCIPGAINIPMSRILEAVEAGQLPLDKTIVTICRSGSRCFVVNSELTARGYTTDVLVGGMVAYRAAL